VNDGRERRVIVKTEAACEEGNIKNNVDVRMKEPKRGDVKADTRLPDRGPQYILQDVVDAAVLGQVLSLSRLHVSLTLQLYRLGDRDDVFARWLHLASFRGDSSRPADTKLV